jgi:hypothetical protein
VGNAILHIEAARDAADWQANPPQPALAKAELRRHELGAHVSLVRHRAIVCVWTAERRFREKSWHAHHRSPLLKWRVRTGRRQEEKKASESDRNKDDGFRASRLVPYRQQWEASIR